LRAPERCGLRVHCTAVTGGGVEDLQCDCGPVRQLMWRRAEPYTIDNCQLKIGLRVSCGCVSRRCPTSRTRGGGRCPPYLLATFLQARRWAMPSLHWIRIGGMSELDVSKLLTVREAIEVIDAVEVRPRVVEVELAEADGLVLAEEVRADRDYPPFDKSQMDGVAIRVQGSGFGVQGSELRLIGEVAAGQWPGRSVGEGEAMAIMTGAPMPAGADAVVPVEETVRVGERVKILKEPVAGKYIARKGSDVREGEVMLEKGVRVGPAQMAVLASVGKARVKCVARPRVAVLGTGDELVGVNEIPARGQIRNSNNVMLASLLQRYGCEVSDLGVVRDDREMIRQKIEAGMSADVLFVTGG